jgi:serine protease AprX
VNKLIIVFALFLASFTSIQAQEYSWVYFTQNDGLSLEQKAAIIQNHGAKVLGSSKWFNASCVEGNPEFLNVLAFIDRIEPLRHYKVHRNQTLQTKATQEEFKYGGSDWQLQMLGLDEYHKRGFTGKGVTIALFDAGFWKVDSLEAFDTLRKRNQIKAGWDFIYKDDTTLYVEDGHGMYVLSIAGGYWPDSIMGAAPDANFLLARTEISNREIKAEELAWVKAMEWADSIGVDIIHSSLGYSVFDTLEGDYEYTDMDGRTTVITQATDIAASKGIFITNSAGNEGAKDWHYITAPCDGRYVLCVGAVDSNQMHADFSSYGPSADGRVKPDVVAMGKGVTYVNKEGQIRTGSGTSFSAPLIAGMVACLKQAWPGATNEHLYNAIVRSADKYTNPDTAYGYGLPNVLIADSLLALYATVDQLEKSDFKIYPNPGSGLIHFSQNFIVSYVRVMDNTGRIVFEKSKLPDESIESIQLEDVALGSYTIEVQFDVGDVVRSKYLKSSN